MNVQVKIKKFSPENNEQEAKVYCEPVFSIFKGYVQDLAQCNFEDRRLTEKEMGLAEEALSGEDEETHRLINEAIFSAIKYALRKEKKSLITNENENEHPKQDSKNK